MSLLVNLWQGLPEEVRLPVLRVVQRNKPVYRRLMFWHTDLKDKANANRSDLPPAELRYRVGASPDADEFVNVGKVCANDIQAALKKSGFDLGSFSRILDFGCGCGRTLMHLKSLAPNADIEGIDIDARAIEWCKEHLSFATFSLSKELPPIDYAADSFDLIYVISVFTHLDENYQFRWLEELRRIAKPGGVVLLTLHGLEGDGEFVFKHSYEKGLFPGWYQNAYHSKKYVFESFSRYFQVLDYFPQGLAGHQDIVVLQKQA